MIRRAALTTLATLAASTAFAGDRALVIGIDSYPALNLDRPLYQAVGDAERFAAFLVSDWGFDETAISVLTNETATSGAILDNLIDRLVGETAPGDRAVFYFAGLGSRIAARTGDEPDGLDEVILAYDTDTVLGKIPERAISDILDILADRDVTVVIDASFDGDAGYRLFQGEGTLARGVSLDATEAADHGTLAKGPALTKAESFAEAPYGAGRAARSVWNAAAPGQFAWETSDGGILTTNFIAGLQGAADANDNGTITNAELLGYLRQTSDEFCQSDATCALNLGGLTPHFEGPIEAALGELKPEPVVVVENQLPVAVGPITYQETLGFVTDLFTPSNSANLRLEINASSPLKLGELVSFSAEADQDGTFVLFDINPNGELAQIFPSALAPEGATAINAGQALTIPSALSKNGQPLQIRVGKPAGRGFLLGLHIQDDLPRLQAILPENLAGGPIPNAGQYLYEIAQDLLKMQANADGNAATQWSATYLPYEIAP